MFEGLGNIARDIWKYALGRGLITTAVLGASSIAATVGLPVIFTVAVASASAVWNVFTRHLEQRRYEKKMLDFYGDEVAAATGKEVGSLTVADLKKTAYGDPSQDIPRNEVLAYALDRQNAKSWLGFGTAIISAVVTFGLLQIGLGSAISEVLNLDAGVGNTVGGLSAGIVAGGSSLLINNGLDGMIGNVTRIHHLSAHDRILRIERTQMRGKAVDPIQVMDVFVAANAELHTRLQKEYGENYQGMNRAEKLMVMKDLGVTSLMGKLAEGLSKGAIEATELAFISNGAEPLTSHGRATLAGTKREAVRVESLNNTSPSFAERVGGSRRSQQSFVDRVQESRAAAEQQAAGIA